MLRFLLFTAVALLCGRSSLRAAGIDLVLAAKGQTFVQTNAAASVANTNLGERFGVFVQVQASSNSALDSASLSNNLIGFHFLDGVSGERTFFFEESFTNQFEADAIIHPGSYTFTIATTNAVTNTVTLTIPADTYPNVPHAANWADGQRIDSFSDFTLRWDALAGGGSNDFIMVSIYQKSGPFSPAGDEEDNSVRTPFIGEPGALNGLSRSLLIPAGKLQPGRTYGASITFVNVFNPNTNALPGALVVAGFYRETELELVTESIPSGGNIRFSSTNLTVNEADGTVLVSIDRLGSTEGEVFVRLATTDLTATAGADYASLSQRVAFPAGISNVTVTIAISNDSLLEGPERFRLGLSSPEGAASLTHGTNAIVTILDSETNSAGKLSFSAAAYQVVESNTTFHVIIRREGGTAGTVGGNILIIGGTATYDVDYDATPGETMTFFIPDGKNSVTNDLNITDDNLPESNETVIMRLANLTGGASLGKISTNTLTILDDESSFSFEVARSTNLENQATATITILRGGSTIKAASVDYAAYVEEAGFAEAFSLFSIQYLIEHQTTPSFTPAIDTEQATSGVDFLGTTGTMTFPKGVVKKNFTVKILDDLTLESTEVIRLALRNPSGAQLGVLSNALLYIKDNDLAGTVSFVMTNQNVKESVGEAKIMVIRTGGMASNIMVRLSTQAGSATDGLDYRGFTSNLVFSGKEMKKTIPLSVIQDAIVESTENLTLTLSTGETAAAGFAPASGPGQYAGLGDKTRLTVNIADDDLGGTISFDKLAYIVNESVTNLAIILKRTGGLASNVTVRLRTVDGPTNSATAGSDYLALDTLVTFGPGELRKTNNLHILNDTVADSPAPETLRLTLTEYTGGAKPGLSNAIVFIVDDESSISFLSATSSGVENRTVTLTVLRGGFLGSTSTVAYMFMDGTASNGVDYTGVAGTLTFKPKEFLKTIIVPIISDPNVETNRETFTVILKNATNALPGTITTNTVSITDAPAVGAIPLEGPGFLKAVTRGVTNSTFSRSITINAGGIDFVNLSSTGDNYGIQARDNFFSPTGSEAFLFFVYNVTGPGVFNVTPNNLQAGLEYNRASTTLSGNFDYTDNDAGTIGTITVDAFDGNTMSGRFDVILNDVDDSTKWVRTVGSFRAKR